MRNFVALFVLLVMAAPAVAQLPPPPPLPEPMTALISWLDEHEFREAGNSNTIYGWDLLDYVEASSGVDFWVASTIDGGWGLWQPRVHHTLVLEDIVYPYIADDKVGEEDVVYGSPYMGPGDYEGLYTELVDYADDFARDKYVSTIRAYAHEVTATNPDQIEAEAYAAVLLTSTITLYEN
jgi:hypothetical protein